MKRTKDPILTKVEEFTGCTFTMKGLNELNDLYGELWYASGENDISLYSSMDYVWLSYHCYKYYSKRYIQRVYKALGGEDIKVVLDFGAGIGATTKLCLELFDLQKIYYLNLPGEQTRFAELLLNGTSTSFIQNLDEIGDKLDIIFALELFEHIKEPFPLLMEFLKLKPKYIVTSNSFHFKAPGHHSVFIVDEGECDDGKMMHKIFKRKMSDAGYIIDDRSKNPNFWNGLPKIWRNK